MGIFIPQKQNNVRNCYTTLATVRIWKITSFSCLSESGIQTNDCFMPH